MSWLMSHFEPGTVVWLEPTLILVGLAVSSGYFILQRNRRS